MPTFLKKLHDRENGFTLIELLIVVLIIGILAAIAIPVYLGIQAQGYKSAVRADVNISVKRVQVGIVEGTGINTIKASPSSYTQRSVKGEVVSIGASPSANAGADDYSISGVVSTASNPIAGPIDYTYTYDSVTGKFTEANSATALPSITLNTSSLPGASVGNAYSTQINATTTNPTGTTSYSATGLPGTFNLNVATGVLSGNPVTTGNYPITITVVNGSVSDTKNYTLNVYSVPSITTTSLPAGIAGQGYNQTVAASGVPTPTIAFAPGSSASNLPSGLSLSGSGVISGTLSSTATTSTFSLVATNSAGTSTPQQFTIVVNSLPVVTTTSLPNAVLNTGYSQTLTATGNPAPTFAITAGSLPPGMNFVGSTGVISGTPTSSGAYSITVKATNSVGDSATQVLSLPVYETATITNATLNDILIGSGASNTVTVAGYPAGNLFGADSFPTCVTPNSDNTYKENGCTSANVGIYGVRLQASNPGGVGPVQSYLLNVRSVSTPDNVNNNFSGGTSGWVAQANAPSITTGTLDSIYGTSLRITGSTGTTTSARTATATIPGGHNYAFESYVNLRSGDSVRLCAYRPSDGYTYCSPSATAKNTWSVLGTTVNISGTGTTDFTFYIEVSGSGTKDVYVDNARIFALN